MADTKISDLNPLTGAGSASGDIIPIVDVSAGETKGITRAELKTGFALVKADVGLGNVDNTADADKPVSTAQQTALDLKAPLASPALTGNPTAPTQATGDSSTKIATTAFVQTIKGGRLLRAPQVLTSGTSYTPPAGCTAILIEMVGGGGGGGGVSTAGSQSSAGGGGASGGYLRKYIAGIGAGPFTIAIGAAGAAGADTGGNGGAGGDTTFNDGTTTYTAKGGGGGIGMTTGTSLLFAAGGAGGGVSTNGDINGNGAPGGQGLRGSASVACSGFGGTSSLGGAGGVGKNAGGAGNAGVGPGAGGGGAANISNSGAVAGGAGTAGMIVIYEYS